MSEWGICCPIHSVSLQNWMFLVGVFSLFLSLPSFLIIKREIVCVGRRLLHNAQHTALARRHNARTRYMCLAAKRERERKREGRKEITARQFAPLMHQSVESARAKYERALISDGGSGGGGRSSCTTTTTSLLPQRNECGRRHTDRAA